MYRANNIAYFRSFLIVLTDGYPEHNSPEDIAAAAAAVRDAEQQCRAASVASRSPAPTRVKSSPSYPALTLP